MKTLMLIPIAAMAAGLGMAGLDSVLPPASGTVQGTPADEVVVMVADSARPWYAASLEALGFFVFPEPKELTPFTVKTLDGTEATVEAGRGKLTMVNFWATWCPPCRAEMPSIQKLWDATRDIPFTIMAIDVKETPSEVKTFLELKKYSFPVYLDQSGAPSAKYASRGIPTTSLLDKQGRAIAYIVGSREYDVPEVLAIIRELAAKLP